MAKVYDCFMFFNELDLLEIRLNILDPYVDYFVLGESEETFSGKPKPLYFSDNMERFSKWRHKIIYLVVPTLPLNFSSFERAGFQKDYLRKKIDIKKISDGDTVYFGDLDEIWKPKEITDNKVYNLRQLNYSYFLNNRSSEEWIGTIVGKWKSVKTNTFNYWRANHENILEDGGWHFTNMGGPDQIRKKLDSYDHQEFNNLENITLIEDRMKDGEDYVGRGVDWQGRPFEFYVDESELPQYILENKEKYGSYFK